MIFCVGSSSSQSYELQEEEVRTYQPAAPEEEAQIDGSPVACSCVEKEWCSQVSWMPWRQRITCCNRHVSRS
jgi:hypothetical protein